MVGGEQVEVLLPGLVVAGDPPRQRLRQGLPADPLAGPGLESRRFEGGEGPAGVAIGLDREPVDRLGIEGEPHVP